MTLEYSERNSLSKVKDKTVETKKKKKVFLDTSFHLLVTEKNYSLLSKNNFNLYFHFMCVGVLLVGVSVCRLHPVLV